MNVLNAVTVWVFGAILVSALVLLGRWANKEA